MANKNCNYSHSPLTKGDLFKKSPQDGDVTLQYVTVAYASVGLEYVSSGGGMSAVYNDMHDNGTDGIYVDSANRVARVHENNLYNNAGSDLRNNSGFGVAADHNRWGATTGDITAGNNLQKIAAISWVRSPAGGSSVKGPNVRIDLQNGVLSGSDFTLSPERGILAISDAAVTINISGAVYCPFIDLAAGPNIIGFECLPPSLTAFELLT